MLKVTAVPANHCPGSVMFLFERLDGLRHSTKVARRILYTGDFRFQQSLHLIFLGLTIYGHKHWMDQRFSNVGKVEHKRIVHIFTLPSTTIYPCFQVR